MNLKVKSILLSILSGLFLASIFPKVDLFFLAWFAFIPLLFAIKKTNAKCAFWLGVLTGFCFYALTIYWLFAMLKFNTGSALQAGISCLILWFYLALYFGVWAYLIKKTKKLFACKILFALWASCLWVGLEYLRTYFLTGFSWELLGYSQHKVLPIIQIAEFFGVYGVSFIIIFINFLIYFWIQNFKQIKFLLGAIAILIVVFGFGFIRLEKFKNFGDYVFDAVIVQPSVDQYKKWDKKYRNEILQELKFYAAEIADTEKELVIWPETAIPIVLYKDRDFDFVKNIAQTAGGFNIFGALFVDNHDLFFNTLIAFKNEQDYYMHKKNHLVVFGEYVPFRKFLAQFFDILNGLGDIQKGKGVEVFFYDKLAVGPLICSENFFPDFSRQLVRSGAQIFTNHTNDAWFFKTAAPYQHFIMNIFRAVENRKMVLVSANSGVSGVIDVNGKVLQQMPIFADALIYTKARQNGYQTFYTKFGDIFVWANIAFAVLALGWAAARAWMRKRRKKKKEKQ
ncbi:MAG: apolipoprotein N-acyltransferase [Elusimicrobiota bacterium]|jgi:apolipoprotein N-acyltransferase|nr:apolipoprotein N-acyltransferase [Elusimicrobiota bacterium]